MNQFEECKIDNIITLYYGTSLKNNLKYLNIHTDKEIKYLVSFFFQKIDFQEYDKLVNNILQISLDRLDKNELQNKIQLFLSNNLFPSIDKKYFIYPGDVLSPISLTSGILKTFFKKILHQTILCFVHETIKNKEFYNNRLKNGLFYDSFIQLKKSIQEYNKTFLKLYTGLINKYDTTGDYIFPVYNTINDNIYFSKVEYNENNKHTNFIKKLQNENNNSSCSSSEDLYKNKKSITIDNKKCSNKDNKIVSNDNNEIGLNKEDWQEKAGAFGVTDEVDIVKKQLNKMFENNIKHTYNKEELKHLEILLENKKINNLIARKELKLSPGFNSVVLNILNKNITDNDRKKFFNEIFDVSDNSNMTKEELYDVYKNEPNKEGFIKYLVDKTLHQNVLQNTGKTDLKVVALVDNIFNKILDEDYNHNTLNLQDDDIKFILMLETLNSIKTSSIGNSSNITVNLFKDVDQTRINKEEIKFN